MKKRNFTFLLIAFALISLSSFGKSAHVTSIEEDTNEAELLSFAIKGYRGIISGNNVTVKVMEGYDFSDQPTLKYSEGATAVWSKANMTVTVTSSGGDNVKTYQVTSSIIEPLKQFPFDVTFGTEYGELPEWLWGAPYDPTVRDVVGGKNGDEIGGLDIKANSSQNQAAGTNELHLYLSSCGSITLKVGATGGRTLYCYVNDVQLTFAPTFNGDSSPATYTFEINSDEPVHIRFASSSETGGIRVYSMEITQGPTNAPQLLSFSIGGYRGAISSNSVTVKVLGEYVFSDEPIMTTPAGSTAVWNKEDMSVVVTSDEDSELSTTYSVTSSQIGALGLLPYSAIFGTSYTLPEWMWGAPYNSALLNVDGNGEVAGDVKGGIELAADTEENQAAGTNKFNLYLNNCENVILELGATGDRSIYYYVNDEKSSQPIRITKEAPTKHSFSISSSNPVHVYFVAEGSTEETRIYSLEVTRYGTFDGINAETTDKSLNFYSKNGILYVNSAEAQPINIYSLDGRLVEKKVINEGEHTFSNLAKGVYLINNQKVVVR